MSFGVDEWVWITTLPVASCMTIIKLCVCSEAQHPYLWTWDEYDLPPSFVVWIEWDQTCQMLSVAPGPQEARKWIVNITRLFTLLWLLLLFWASVVRLGGFLHVGTLPFLSPCQFILYGVTYLTDEIKKHVCSPKARLPVWFLMLSCIKSCPFSQTGPGEIPAGDKGVSIYT